MKVKIKSPKLLHPFCIVKIGDKFAVHRGLVVKVDSGEQFPVTDLEKDLRYEPTDTLFDVGSSVYLTIEHQDPSILTKDTSVDITSVYVTTESMTSYGVTSFKIGSVTGELVTQEIRSDFYFNIYGTQ